MEIIISNAANKPIYEQITSQIKAQIMSGALAEGEQLPSIRSLANDLRVSVITTKRAYADLEQQGFIVTSPGRGSFVAGGNKELVREEHLRSIESYLQRAIDEAAEAGVSAAELKEILELLLD